MAEIKSGGSALPEAEKPYDAGDAADVKDAAKEAKRKELRKTEFLVAAMNREDGREWFHGLLVQTHCFQNPFNAANDRLTSFNCGEMNIGLPILADLNNLCPEQYLLMMKENSNG